MNHGSSLSLTSPYHHRLAGWFNERFPASNLAGIPLLYITIYLYGYISQGGALSQLNLPNGQIYSSLSHIFAITALLLLMRIIDEHKDFQHDTLHYPDRILQRGLISLQQLRYLGLFATAILIFPIVSMSNTQTTLSFAAVLFWLTLMSKEFWCSTWLKSKPLTYAFSHSIILVFMVWWIAQLAQPGSNYTPIHLYLQLFALSGGFCCEILRKFRAPEELASKEDQYADAYNHTHGDRFLLNLTLFFFALFSLSQILLINTLSYSKEYVISEAAPLKLIILGCLMSLYFYNRYYLKKPSKKSRKILLGTVATGMLAGYGVLLYGLFCQL